MVSVKVAGPPEHLGAGLGRGGRRRAHQSGLANTRFALDEYRAPASPGDLSNEPGQQRHLAITADQPTGRRNRVHTANFTT